MKRAKLLVCLFVMALAGTGFGYGYVDAMNMGSPMPGIDAVAQGFGGVASVNVGNMCLFGNPAELTRSEARVDLSIGPLILKQSVDDGLGKHTLTYPGLGAASFQAGFSLGETSIALGFAKIRDYTYKGEYFFLEEEPDTVIAGFENLTVSGGVYEAAAGFAVKPMDMLNLGVAAGYRMGTIDYEYYWHHFSETIEDSTSEWSREEGEFAWRAGASFETASNATIGAVYSSETENCPASYAAGVVFGDIARGFPGVGVEARLYEVGENTAWTALVFGGIHPEHNLFFRGAASLSSKGTNSSTASLGLAVGATIKMSWADVHMAFNYGSERRDSDVFGFPSAETIDDIVTAVSVGLSVPL